jgi:Glyoxalase/Bleomycin resistance protein/Dioxygenase superfamily
MATKRKTNSNVVAQPLIAVDDVIASTRWYTKLLDGDAPPESDHGDVYERVCSNGQVLLQLHSWDDEDHPNLQRKKTKAGHGVLIWFQVDDFDACLERIHALGAEIVEDEHENPNAEHREIWFKDLDGYVVVVASKDGETA